MATDEGGRRGLLGPQLAWGLTAGILSLVGVLVAGGSAVFAIMCAIVAGLVAALQEDRILSLGKRPRRNRHVDI